MAITMPHLTTAAENNLVMLIEDEPDMRAIVARWLEKDGYRVQTPSDARDALDMLARSSPSAICLDLDLPDMSGLDALLRIKEIAPGLPVVILTANCEVHTVVTAMQRGAYDYLAKPLDRSRLCDTIRSAIERSRPSWRLPPVDDNTAQFGKVGLVGQSKAMQALYRQIEQVGPTDVSVVIQGESGTGKELVARAVHEHSGRSDGKFVAVNCAAIPETLQESEFFGHERGAFTGAHVQRKGRFEQAHGGTLFLDEIAECSLPLQAKLLRVLQERCFQRVGGSDDIASDFRLLAATHRDLAAEVRAGRFREDLYFRIAVFELKVPPLRERHHDVSRLAQAFLERLAPEREITFDPDALVALENHSWPGNVRELQNAVQHALVVCRTHTVTKRDLPPRLFQATQEETPAREPDDQLPLKDVERRVLKEALERANGNISEVVRQLGIGRTTVYRKMKKYGLR